MTEEEMTDLIHELIAVETDVGLVRSSVAISDEISFTISGGESFKVAITKL